MPILPPDAQIDGLLVGGFVGSRWCCGGACGAVWKHGRPAAAGFGSHVCQGHLRLPVSALARASVTHMFARPVGVATDVFLWLLQQPVRQRPSRGFRAGCMDSNDGGYVFGLTLVLRASWTKDLAMTTPVSAASPVGALHSPALSFLGKARSISDS
jgi:hypothetical protein